MLPEPLPEGLQRYLDARAIILEKALQNREFDEAYRGYEELYRRLLAEQPPGKRYHKGYPLHNMGYAVLLKGDAQRALPLFIAAYIEDLLSQPIGEEDNADTAPASTVLTRVYQVSPNFLRDLKAIVREKKQAGTVVRDPQDIARELGRHPAAKGEPRPEAKPRPEVGMKEPGSFHLPWEKRVFVGGDYRAIADIDLIRRIVENLGFQPVVVLDYRVPSGLIHHHSLMLLHECKYAIFDFSHQSGQLMEVERVRDYGVQTLIVFQTANPSFFPVSEMVKALVAEEEIKVEPYRDFDELRSKIHTFLVGEKSS